MQQNIKKATEHFNNETQSVLSIRLLGAYELKAPNGATPDLGSRKAQALLAYLAVTDKLTPRDTLTLLFWPEMADQRAKNNLRTMLSLLKQHFAPYLDITTTTVAFNRHQPYFLDVETFQHRLNEAIATQDLAGLQAAVALYRGEFLQGFNLRNAEPFEEWVLQRREHLHLLMLGAFEALVTMCVERGEYSMGMAAAHNLLSMEPWSEVAHRQLMILLANSGQRGKALAQYERCRQILADELGAEPMPETTMLYHQILAGTFAQSQLDRAPASPLSTTTPVSQEPPPTHSFLSIHHNLTAPLTQFIGRKQELDFLDRRLAAGRCRLLTITGPGGIGKTALALAWGRRLIDSSAATFSDGLFFVSLATVSGNGHDERDGATPTDAIIASIAESLGRPFQEGHSLQVQLQEYLQTRRLLLILDNFEQLVDYSDVIITLLTNAPNLTMLITSRVRLNVRGETILTLQGLSLPTQNSMTDSQPHAIRQKSEAVALFAERAECLDADFALNAETIEQITEICQLVGGLPLAIEMIAAWLSLYSCAEIAHKLKQGIAEAEWLSSRFRDQPARQQSLQRVFADSWALLPSTLQWKFAQLSIFTKRFTRNAAQTIAATTLSDLMRLHDHSMLQMIGDDFYALHPLVNQFAAQKWQELTEREPHHRYLLQQAHSHFYLQQVADLMDKLRGKEALAAIRSFQHDHADIVRGWQWAVQEQDHAQIQCSMSSFFRYLELTNQSMEGERLFGQAVAQQRAPLAQWLQVAQCHFLRRLAEHDQARIRLEALVTTLAPLLTDRTDTPDSASTASIAATYIFALCELGWVYYEQGDFEAAHRCFSTAHRHTNTMDGPVNIMQVLNGLGAVAFGTKRYADAREFYQAALGQAQQRDDLHFTAIVLGNLAAMAQTTHAYEEAEHYLRLRLQIDEQTQNGRQMAVSYQRLGQLALLRNSYASAEVNFRKSLAHFEQLGNSPEIAHVLLDLSKSLLRQNLRQEAEIQCLRGLHLAHQAQITPRILAALTLLAEIRFAKEKKDEAATLLQIVSRHAELPVATHNTAQQLQAQLAEELGAEMMTSIHQKTVGQSLQEFSLVLLRSRDSFTNTSFTNTSFTNTSFTQSTG